MLTIALFIFLEVAWFFFAKRFSDFLVEKLCDFCCEEVARFLCEQVACFFLCVWRGCVIFVWKSFLVKKSFLGKTMSVKKSFFLTHSLRLHDLFFWRLKNFLLQRGFVFFCCWEFVCFLCEDVARFFVWRGCMFLFLCEEVAFFCVCKGCVIFCVKRFFSEKKVFFLWRGCVIFC